MPAAVSGRCRPYAPSRARHSARGCPQSRATPEPEWSREETLKRLESNGNTVGRLMAEYNERGGAVAYRHDGQSPGTGASPREAHGASGTLRTIEVDAQVDPRWEAFVVAQ